MGAGNILERGSTPYNATVSRLVRAHVAGLVLIGSSSAGTGCEGPHADEDAEVGDEDAGGEPAGPPVIVEPLEVTVSASQRQDITIVAADLLANARVELDGHSWSLTEPGPVVRAGQTLRVPLGGALVVGQHQLVVVHRDGKKELRSEPLPITVEAAELDPLVATLEPELVGVGDQLVDVGPGERLLAIVNDAAQSVELRLGDWSTAGVVQALPELGGPAGPISGRVDVTLTEVDEQSWLVTTWLADGGDRVRARITPLDDDDQLGEPGEVLELWNLADPDHRALLGPHELAFGHGVALLDRMVVIAVEARRDAEQPSPGDRMLVTRWLTADATPAAIQTVHGPGGRDLDLPHRARMWLDLGEREPTLSLRLALAFPWLLELAGNGLPVLTDDPGEQADAPGAVAWMACADGALGSRHAFALELDGPQARVRVLRIDRWGEPSFVETPVVDVIELPAMPTAAPSLSMVAGSPTLMVPFGIGTPAWAVRSTGDTALLDEFVQLGCDAFALAQPDVDGEGDILTLACIAAGELRIGSMTFSE
jgi:hypothetical protein